MEMLVIKGGTPLQGSIAVDGAKNAVLPIMAASLAVRGEVRLKDVPNLVDVSTMAELLRSLGVAVDCCGAGGAVIDAGDANRFVADYELVRRMRASICVLGPLLARFGKARVSLPGGCNIGHRPVDLHLRGLAALGADLRIERGYVVAETKQLQGADIDLGGPHGSTVTGTCNVMVAAALARGRSIIRSAACEPEVVDVGQFLNQAGAVIRGLGTSEIEIQGVEELAGTAFRVQPDRIEAATLAIAAAATRGHVTIRNAPVEHLTSVLEALREIGVRIEQTGPGLDVSCSDCLRATDIRALPFPGVPTDTQAQFMALLTTVRGRSTVSDSVFPDRFMHAAELLRMGARIQRDGISAVIEGGHRLTGAGVMASDLRASAALVIAGLAAEGETQIRRIYHLDRGYASLDGKLNSLGAKICRVDDTASAGSTRSPHFLRQPQIEPLSEKTDS